MAKSDILMEILCVRGWAPSVPEEDIYGFELDMSWVDLHLG